MRQATLRALAGRGACAVAWIAISRSIVLAQGVLIDHAGVRCVEAERFAVVEARLQPDRTVARARVLFRAAGSLNWYYVEMTQSQGLFRGILPKPLRTTSRIEYYIEALDLSLQQSRTQEYSPLVAEPGQCKPSLRTAAAAATTRISLGSLAPRTAHLPPGFSPDGIAGLIAGEAAAAGVEAAGPGTGAAAAGGLSKGAVLAIVGGGAIAGGIAIAAGSSSSAETSPAGPSLTGHWAGSYIFQTNILCDVEMDLTADLTQTGSNLAGPGTFRTRTSARPDCGIQDVRITLNGTLAGSAVTLTLVHLECTSTMRGTVSGNTMAGTWVESGSGGCEGQTGIWNLTLVSG